MSSDQVVRERIYAALDDPQTDKSDLLEIIWAACDLKRNLYEEVVIPDSTKPLLYRLRKALEGIFGHEIPTSDD